VWALTRCAKITAAVSYYYVLPHGKPDFSKLKGSVLGHFGTADEFVPTDAAEELESEIRSAGGDVTFHYYEGATHAFFNDVDRPERVGVHDPAAAQSSWERTLGFLREALDGSA
jgi:carboxymethylenebutenolidase